MTPGSLLFLSLVAMVSSVAVAPRLSRTWSGLTVLGAASAFGAALLVLTGPSDWQWRGGIRLGGEALHLRLDGLSALFLILASAVGAIGAVDSRGYGSEGDHATSAPRGRAWWSALLLSIGLVLTASNGLHFLVAWELFAVCAYFLIRLDRERPEVRRAAWLYLAASHAGTAFLFAFFAALAAVTGSWDLGPLPGRGDLAPFFWLALLGFAPMLVAGTTCLAIGLFPLLLWPALLRAVGTWNAAWAAGDPPNPLHTLGTVQVTLFSAALAATGLVSMRARVKGVRRATTWDCGYAMPSAKMQYTSASFGGLAATWFSWLLRPERRLRRPRGPFPAGALRLERVPDAVLERVVAPVAAAFVLASGAARRLHHGRLQAYVLYVVVGLVALGIVATLGGMP